MNTAKKEIKYNKQRIEEDVKAYDLATKASDKTTNWIPVSERLPDKSDYFLVSVIVNKYKVVVVDEAWFANKNDYDDIEESEWRELGGANVTVIAWMPLPEPYKAEKEEKE